MLTFDLENRYDDSLFTTLRRICKGRDYVRMLNCKADLLPYKSEKWNLEEQNWRSDAFDVKWTTRRLEIGLTEGGPILGHVQRGAEMPFVEDQRIDNQPVRRKTIVWKTLFGPNINHLVMTDQMLFDRSHSIRRRGIKLESRKPTEGGRVNHRDKQILHHQLGPYQVLY